MILPPSIKVKRLWNNRKTNHYLCMANKMGQWVTSLQHPHKVSPTTVMVVYTVDPLCVGLPILLNLESCSNFTYFKEYLLPVPEIERIHVSKWNKVAWEQSRLNTEVFLNLGKWDVDLFHIEDNFNCDHFCRHFGKTSVPKWSTKRVWTQWLLIRSASLFRWRVVQNWLISYSRTPPWLEVKPHSRDLRPWSYSSSIATSLEFETRYYLFWYIQQHHERQQCVAWETCRNVTFSCHGCKENPEWGKHMRSDRDWKYKCKLGFVLLSS